jgi:hypothetical protein
MTIARSIAEEIARRVVDEATESDSLTFILLEDVNDGSEMVPILTVKFNPRQPSVLTCSAYSMDIKNFMRPITIRSLRALEAFFAAPDGWVESHFVRWFLIAGSDTSAVREFSELECTDKTPGGLGRFYHAMFPTMIKMGYVLVGGRLDMNNEGLQMNWTEVNDAVAEDMEMLARYVWSVMG